MSRVAIHLESAQRTEIKPHLDIKSNGAHDNGSPPLSLPPSTLALLPRGKRAPVVWAPEAVSMAGHSALHPGVNVQTQPCRWVFI